MHRSSSEPDAGSCQSGDSASTNTACYPAAEGLQIQPMKPWIRNSSFATELTPNAIQPSTDTSETEHFLKTTSKAEHFAARNCSMKRPFIEVKLNNSIASKGVSSSISKRKKAEEEASERLLNDSDSLYDSFDEPDSILESIDFDQLDGCINEVGKTEHSKAPASSVSSDDFPVPDNIPYYAGGCFTGHQSKDGIADNCIPDERTALMLLSRDKSKALPTVNTTPNGGISCQNSGLNILQAIDIADNTSPPCPPCAPADPSAVSSCKISVADSNRRRVSVFADRLRKTFAANAKLDTPVRRRQMASVLNGCSEESDGNLKGKTGFHSNPENSFYGLPLRVKELLIEHRSISELYDWQKECLSLRAVYNGSNLIYSLPTSGGKTLVAEMLILRQILCRKKDAILILPFVAIVQEKVRAFTPFAIELEFCIEEYAASKGAIPPRQLRSRQSLYIATIEKANSLINSLIEKKRIDCIGLVVVDELHMLGEGGSRGATLETTLTKVIYSNPGTQIVGMSATLSNIKDIQKFLNAEVYTSNFRPVQLKEFVKFDDTIYEVDCAALNPDECLKFSRVTAFKYNREMSVSDPDQLAGLVLEVVPGNSCLVFCPTKKNCENVAQLLCKMFPNELRELKSKERRLLYESLKLEGGGVVCPVLCATMPYGVGYHHGGLTSDERRLIEEAYLDGTLCVLTCTSTLAAGVNLPARRVILRSSYVGRSFISRSQYKQMTGRAGRAGIDTIGESILLITSPADKKKLQDLVGGSYDRCVSSLLYEGNKGIRSLLLSAVGLQITNSVGDVVAFMSRTLCHIQSHLFDVSVTEVTKNALQQLIDTQLLRRRMATGESLKESDGQEHEQDTILEVTDLGRAVFKGSIDVDYSQKLYADLSLTQQSIVLDNYLHLLFLVTPYDMVDVNQVPNWMTYLRELGTLSVSELKVASLVGVSENQIARKATGHNFRQQVDEFAVSRFYLSLMLYNLWKQKTIWEVSSHFRVSRGFVQQLLTGAASFGTCINYFCQELDEFWGYQDLMTSFVKKLSFCCMLELAPLMEIPGVKMGRARQLHRAGYRSLQHIAYADPNDLVRQIEHLPRRLARQIVSSAQMVLTEKAEAILAEVDDMISVPPPPPADTSIIPLTSSPENS